MSAAISRNYDLTLASNATQNIDVVGDFVKVITATGGAVKIICDTGYEVDALPGQGLRDIPFNRLSIRNISGVANKVILLAGGARMVDDRVTGEIAIDGGRQATLSGRACMGSQSIALSAGNSSAVTLMNNSTLFHLWVKSMWVQASVATTIRLVIGIGSLLILPAGGSRRKNGGGPSVAAVMRTENGVGAAPPVNLGTETLGVFSVEANKPFPILLQEPLQVRANTAGLNPHIGVWSATPCDLTLTVEHFEELVV